MHTDQQAFIWNYDEVSRSVRGAVEALCMYETCAQMVPTGPVITCRAWVAWTYCAARRWRNSYCRGWSDAGGLQRLLWQLHLRT